MTYYVYILYSETLNRFYTGTTDNVVRRIEEHNSKYFKDAFTSKGILWTLFLEIECGSSAQAYKLEGFIKKMKSSEFIKKLKAEPEIIDSLLKRFE